MYIRICSVYIIFVNGKKVARVSSVIHNFDSNSLTWNYCDRHDKFRDCEFLKIEKTALRNEFQILRRKQIIRMSKVWFIVFGKVCVYLLVSSLFPAFVNFFIRSSISFSYKNIAPSNVDIYFRLTTTYLPFYSSPINRAIICLVTISPWNGSTSLR